MTLISEEDSGIAGFLAKPENLGTAYDVAEFLPQVVEELYLKFWADVGRLVQDGISNRSVSTWSVNFFRNDDDSDRRIPISREFPIDAQFAGLKIEPTDASDRVLSCSFAIEQYLPRRGADRGGLYYGIRYSRALRRADVTAVRSATTDLAARLRRRGWTEVPDEGVTEARVDDWWIGNSEYVLEFVDRKGIRPFSRAQAIAAAAEELQKQVSDKLLEFFDAEHTAAERLNDKLKGTRAASSRKR